jgi:hypothetical protein
VAAQVDAWVGAALIAGGLLGLIVAGRDQHSLGLEVSDVILMFVVAMVLLAAGFYGQVAAPPYGEQSNAHRGD